MTIQELDKEIFTPNLNNKFEYPFTTVSLENGVKYLDTCITAIKTEMNDKYPEIPLKVLMTKQPDTGWITLTFIVVIDGMPYYAFKSYTSNDKNKNPILIEKQY